jgi:hypothetical protein
MSKKAMKLALEALLTHEYELRKVGQSFRVEPAIKALEEALAKQEQGEPVEHTAVFKCPNCAYPHRVVTHITGAPVPPWEATTPQQRTWVGLTHEEIDYQANKDDHGFYFVLGALWAEVKLKEKNGA